METRYPDSAKAAWAPTPADSAAGFGLNRQPEPPKLPLIDHAIERTENAIKQIAELTAHVSEFAHRTLGSMPESGHVTGRGAADREDTRGATLREQLDLLHAQIGALRSQVNRLGQI